MNLLRELRHSNVVIYMGACLEQARLLIVHNPFFSWGVW